MKKLFLAGAVVFSMTVLAATAKHETPTMTKNQQTFQDSPPPGKNPIPGSGRPDSSRFPRDTSKRPWPDSLNK